MSDFLNRMKSAAKADLKTIVLPEGEDPRTIVAATKIIEEGLAKIVILGNPDEIDVAHLHHHHYIRLVNVHLQMRVLLEQVLAHSGADFRRFHREAFVRTFCLHLKGGSTLQFLL